MLASLDRVPSAVYVPGQPDRNVNALWPLPRLWCALKDDHSFTCRTALPICEGAEAGHYLSIAFEADHNAATLRLLHEHTHGLAPVIVTAHLCPVPPSDFLLHHWWARLCMAQWRCYGPMHINAFMTSNMEDMCAWSHTLLEWAVAMRPTNAAYSTLERDTATWTDDTLPKLGLLPPTQQEIQAMVWENNTFLFCHDMEQLAMHLHHGLRVATSDRTARLWAHICDNLHRVWGPGLTYFPDAHEPTYLDSADDLVQLRHWQTLARLVSQWELPSQLRERVQVTMGGPVRGLEAELQGVLRELELREFGLLTLTTGDFPTTRASQGEA